MSPFDVSPFKRIAGLYNRFISLPRERDGVGHILVPFHGISIKLVGIAWNAVPLMFAYQHFDYKKRTDPFQRLYVQFAGMEVGDVRTRLIASQSTGLYIRTIRNHIRD